MLLYTVTLRAGGTVADVTEHGKNGEPMVRFDLDAEDAMALLSCLAQALPHMRGGR